MAAALARLSRKTLSSAPFRRSLSYAAPTTDRINWDSEAYSGEDLLKCLDKELTRHFENTVLLWTLDPAERDAQLASEAGIFFNSRRTPSPSIPQTHHHRSNSKAELLAARAKYHQQFKRSLEEDVTAHTKGDFRKGSGN